MPFDQDEISPKLINLKQRRISNRYASDVLAYHFRMNRCLTSILASVDGGQIMPESLCVRAVGGLGVHVLVFVDHRAVEGETRIGP